MMRVGTILAQKAYNTEDTVVGLIWMRMPGKRKEGPGHEVAPFLSIGFVLTIVQMEQISQREWSACWIGHKKWKGIIVQPIVAVCQKHILHVPVAQKMMFSYDAVHISYYELI